MPKRKSKATRWTSFGPRMINAHLWYYDERCGLTVVSELDECTPALTRVVTLPWKQVCQSVDRYRKILRARKQNSAKRKGKGGK